MTPTPTLLPTATAVPAATSLREKIGYMVMTGFPGQSVQHGSAIATDIANGSLAGTVLYNYGSPPRNISSPEQLVALTRQLQELAPSTLLVAVDQEGGQVARLSPENGFPGSYSAAQLGALDDVEFTYRATSQMAATLAAEGINLNFAPVVDLNINPANPVIGALGRSFSADPEVVTRQAESFISAHHDAGVLCTLKHFPGHGSSTADSHVGFVDVTETWTEQELDPFANLIAAGLPDAVMTAHIFNARLDPEYPATLSQKIITGILRDELGFDGVVISDSMLMGAITEQYGMDVAVPMAIEAGVDIVLFSSSLYEDQDVAVRAVDLIESAVRAGRIGEERINTSYERVRSLRARARTVAV